jgi:NADP-dependent 3-hydroxy acid dehydrogenase YdfG
MQKVVEEGTKKMSPIDVLVNNAGISILGALEDFRLVLLNIAKAKY